MDTNELRLWEKRVHGGCTGDLLLQAADEIDRLRDRMQGAHETIKALTTERDAARAEVARIGAEYTAATAQANATLDKYRAEVERANVAARDARVEAERWSAADSAALAAVTADHGILLAEVDEANTALDEAGEPRDVGEGALSLASRIRNLAHDRDQANETGKRVLESQMKALKDAEQLRAEVERVRHGCGACGPESAGVIDRLRADVERLTAKVAALREAVEAAYREGWSQARYSVGSSPNADWKHSDARAALTPASEPEKEER